MTGRKNRRDDYLGKRYLTNNSGYCTVIEYIQYKNVVVKFDDGYIKRTTIKELKKGALSNPNVPTVLGFGFNDTKTNTIVLNRWHHMLKRVYSTNFKNKNPSYKNTKCHEDFHYLSKFNSFVNSFKHKDYYLENGWEIDKDLLIKGNVEYSPMSCCFLPKEINGAITKQSNTKDLPLGVYYRKSSKKYVSQVSLSGKKVTIGYFDNPEDAFLSFKKEKEKHLKLLAEKYKEYLIPEAYDALTNYEVTPYVT